MLTAKDEEGWAVAHEDTFLSWAESVEPDDETLWDHWTTHLKYTFTPAQITSEGSIEMRYVAQQEKQCEKHSALSARVGPCPSRDMALLYAFSPDRSRLDVRGLRMHEIYEQALNHERDPSIALNRHLDKAIRYGMDAPQAFTGFH